MSIGCVWHVCRPMLPRKQNTNVLRLQGLSFFLFKQPKRKQVYITIIYNKINKHINKYTYKHINNVHKQGGVYRRTNTRTYGCTDVWWYGCTDIQAWEHMDIRMYERTHAHAHARTDARTYVCMYASTYVNVNAQTYGRTDVQMYRHTDVQTHGHMDTWTYERTDIWTCRQTDGRSQRLVLHTWWCGPVPGVTDMQGD